MTSPAAPPCQNRFAMLQSDLEKCLLSWVHPAFQAARRVVGGDGLWFGFSVPADKVWVPTAALWTAGLFPENPGLTSVGLAVYLILFTGAGETR